jgi:3-phenylpropionate/trans-cinnamate dioxygenase ferredoxin subunit
LISLFVTDDIDRFIVNTPAVSCLIIRTRIQGYEQYFPTSHIKYLVLIHEQPNPKRWHNHVVLEEGGKVSDFIPVAIVTDVKDGTMKKIMVEGYEFLLARIQERYYCTDAYCPHLGGDLSQGTLAGTVLTCPLHHSQFDITDGRILQWTDLSGTILTAAKNQRPPRSLRTYPVKIEGNSILVNR